MPMDNTPGSITDPQWEYIKGLVKKKDLIGNTRYTPTREQLEFFRAGDYSGMSKLQASKAIEKLLMLNDKPPEPAIPMNRDIVEASATPLDLSDADVRPQGTVDAGEFGTITAPSQPTPVQALENRAREVSATPLDDEVSAGFYFIVDPTDNVEKFFHVTKGKEGGRWEGRTFLEVRASDTTYPIKLAVHREAVYREILKDPVKAMNEYGIRIGNCGCCGRTLTARDSRLRGIGPICAARLMMEDAQATDDQLDMLRSLGLKKD